jgi:hypothetical protein
MDYEDQELFVPLPPPVDVSFWPDVVRTQGEDRIELGLNLRVEHLELFDDPRRSEQRFVAAAVIVREGRVHMAATNLALLLGTVDAFVRHETGDDTRYAAWRREQQRAQIMAVLVLLGRAAALRAAEVALRTPNTFFSELLDALTADLPWLAHPACVQPEFIEALCTIDCSTNATSGAYADVSDAPEGEAGPVMHAFSTAQAVHLLDRQYGPVEPRSENVVAFVVTSVFRIRNAEQFLALPPDTCLATLRLSTGSDVTPMGALRSDEVVRMERQHVRIYDPLWSELPPETLPDGPDASAVESLAFALLLEQRLAQFPYVICAHVLYRVGQQAARALKGPATEESEEGAVPIDQLARAEAATEQDEIAQEPPSAAPHGGTVQTAAVNVEARAGRIAAKTIGRYARTYLLQHEPFWMEPLLASWHALAHSRASPTPLRVPLARLVERPLRADMMLATPVGLAPLCAYSIAYVTPSLPTTVTTAIQARLARAYQTGEPAEVGFFLHNYAHRVVQLADVAFANRALALVAYADSKELERFAPAPAREGRVFADMLMEPGMPISPTIYSSILNAVLADDLFFHLEPRQRKGGGAQTAGQLREPVVSVRYGAGCALRVEPGPPRANGLREVLAVSPVHLEDLLLRLEPPQ